MVLDSKRLKEEQPKLYNSYLKPSESNEIKVDVDKKEERINEQEINNQAVDSVMDKLKAN